MLTLKLKYKCLETDYYDILNKYMSQYSICLHYLYNRISDNNGNISEKDLRTLCSNINNIDIYWIRGLDNHVSKNLLHYINLFSQDIKNMKKLENKN